MAAAVLLGLIADVAMLARRVRQSTFHQGMMSILRMRGTRRCFAAFRSSEFFSAALAGWTAGVAASALLTFCAALALQRGPYMAGIAALLCFPWVVFIEFEAADRWLARRKRRDAALNRPAAPAPPPSPRPGRSPRAGSRSP